jgi:hypothetical protein
MWTSPRRWLGFLAGGLALLGGGPAAAQGPSLRIFPPPGQYLSTQGFDFVLIADTGGRGAVGGLFTLDGQDVTGPLLACSRLGVTAAGLLTARCPGLAGATLGPGIHVFRAQVFLEDGSTLEGGAVWEVLAAADP